MDFSCNKPACCILKNNKYDFCLWPLELDDKSIVKLEAASVSVNSRPRLEMGTDSSEKFRWHIAMANELVSRIIETIKSIVLDEKVMFSFEGSSFGSKGDAGLQLAGYRYLLVSELGKLYGLKNIFTYAPLTVKSVAGCATKDKKGKDSMINAFGQACTHPLALTIKNNSMALKKKTNYVSGVDDLADAYWVLQTLRVKELGLV